jgi:hypothetical protein
MVKKGDYVGELSDYIKKNLRKGYTKESLKWALVKQGHSKLEVEKAIRVAEDELSKEAPVLKTKPEITYDVVSPKDAIVEEKKPFWRRVLGL